MTKQERDDDPTVRATKSGFEIPIPRPKGRYREAIRARNVKKRLYLALLERFIDRFSRINLMLAVLLSVLIGAILSWSLNCNTFPIFLKCETSTIQTKIPYNESEHEISSSGIVEKYLIKTSILQDASFSEPIFRGWLLLSAFVLAFARWQVTNRHSSMSEVFDRKQASNLQILAHRDKVQDLVSGAIELTSQDIILSYPIEVKPEQAKNLVKHFKSYNPYGRKGPDFVQKMFVYIELDNLEFSHMKYLSGVLDAEQFYRSIEIFESRCHSSLFRHIAARQGLAYYTDEFHDLIVACLIFGYVQSTGNVEPPENPHQENLERNGQITPAM